MGHRNVGPELPSGGHGQNVANVAANRLLGLVDGPELSKFEIGIEPELAKTWEEAPDGLTYTFHLNEGVRFHNIAPVNGRELVAQDVKLAYDRAATEGINQAFFDFLDGIAVPDDNTVEIRLHTPDADFLIPVASRQLPIYAPELYEGDLFETLAIGTGPRSPKDFKDGQGITIDANPDYWEGKPWLDGMEWIISPDAATRTAEFRVGRIDWGAAASTPEAVDALRETNPDIQVTSDPSRRRHAPARAQYRPTRARRRARATGDVALDRSGPLRPDPLPGLWEGRPRLRLALRVRRGAGGQRSWAGGGATTRPRRRRWCRPPAPRARSST